MRSLTAAVFLVLVAVACGGGSSGTQPGSPTNPNGPIGFTNSPGGVKINVFGNSNPMTFSFTFQNQTNSAYGDFTFNGLQAGTYEVSGQMSDGGLGFSFQNVCGNAKCENASTVVVDTFQSLDGPNPVLSRCVIQYGQFDHVVRSFRFQFTMVQTSTLTFVNNACGTPQ